MVRTEIQKLHYRLLRDFTKKGICVDCGKVCKTDFSLNKGKEYEYNINNFSERCRRCHRNYDKPSISPSLPKIPLSILKRLRAEAWIMYQNGSTLAEIAVKQGVDISTASRRIKRAKVVPSLAEDKLKNNV